MKVYTKVISLILATCLAAPAMAGTRNVDCDAGDSLQNALASGQGSAAPIEIEVTGTCYGTFTMSRDHVTILGDGSTTIHGTLRMFSSQQVVIRNIIFTGPGDGLRITNSRARIFDTQIVNNDGVGIHASDTAVVRLSRSQVGNNGGPHGLVAYGSNVYLSFTDVYGHSEYGVAATDNSLANIRGGSITGNGVGVYGNNSVVSVRDTWIGDNIGDGVSLGGARVTLYDVTISGNGSIGLFVNFTGSAMAFGGAIENNGGSGIFADLHAVVGLDGTRVVGNGHHGIELVRDAGAIITGTSYVPANLSGLAAWCGDEESSLQVDEPAEVGDRDDCTGF